MLKVLESRRLLKHQTLTYISRPCTLKVILSFNCCRNSCAIKTALTSSGHAVMNFKLNVLMLISSLVKFSYWEVKRTETAVFLTFSFSLTLSLSLSISLSVSSSTFSELMSFALVSFLLSILSHVLRSRFVFLLIVSFSLS